MTTKSTLTCRRDIRGLHVIAVTLVVLTHTNISAASGGFIGVNAPLMISSYFITDFRVREYATTWAHPTRRFPCPTPGAPSASVICGDQGRTNKCAMSPFQTRDLAPFPRSLRRHNIDNEPIPRGAILYGLSHSRLTRPSAPNMPVAVVAGRAPSTAGPSYRPACPHRTGQVAQSLRPRTGRCSTTS